MAGFSITIAGDSALNLEFAHSISPETSAMIRLAAENLTADPIEGITELVPTFCSLMVYYNPLVVTFDELSARLRGKLRDVGEADLSVRKIVQIPVCYGGEYGPDLANVVERNVGRPEGQALIDADVQKNLEGLVRDEQIECCVLGCTHYPLVEENIHRLFPGLRLLDPAEQMAKDVLAYLERDGLVNDGPQPGRLDIFTTGSAEEYAMKAEKVGLDPVTSVQFYPPMKL